MVAQASGVYERLTEKWAPEETFSRNVGGLDLTYVSGEQVVTRLNTVLGVDGWSYRVVEHGLNSEADAVWVLGEITAYFRDEENPQHQREVTRQQFGGQKIKRRRETGTPVDIGFDLKGATTDALKKCAAALGVGLYLSEREARAQDDRSYTPQQVHQNGQASFTPRVEQGGLFCDECQTELQEIVFRNGDRITPAKMADMGQRKFGRTLCMTHYKELNDRRKAQENRVSADPFGGPSPDSLTNWENF